MHFSIYALLLIAVISTVSSRASLVWLDEENLVGENETEIVDVEGIGSSLNDSSTDPCVPNPCMNGGTCSSEGDEAYCMCLNFRGQFCERGPCETYSCMNGGTCRTRENSPGEAICTCPPGFVGDHCERNACVSNPCLNGGTCATSNGEVSCMCLPDFFGRLCEGRNVPYTPINLTASSRTSTSLVVQWDVPELPPGFAENYRVQWINDAGIRYRDASGSAHYYNITGLRSARNYTVKVRLHNIDAIGPWSEELQVQTEKRGVPYRPANLTASFITSTSIMVEWDIPLWMPLGFDENYEVQWKSDVGTEYRNAGDSAHYNITGLMPNKNYTVKVRLYNTYTSGPWSEEFQVQTEKREPLSPTNLISTDVSSTSMLFSWDFPFAERRHIYGFEVEWMPSEMLSILKKAFTTDTSMKISNLLPSTAYTVRVRAISSSGSGPWSDLNVTTGRREPLSPTNLVATDVNRTSMLLSWDFPFHEKRLIYGFEVEWIASEMLAILNKDFTTDTSLKISNLLPSTSYTMRVRAMSSMGSGPWSDLNVTTGRRGVPAKISAIIAPQVTPTSIRFQFMGPTDEGGLPVTHYIVTCYEAHDLESVRKFEWEKGASYVVRGLKPRIVYTFFAAARNALGDGPWRTESYRMPNPTVPEPPTVNINETLSAYPDRFEVQWEAPEDNGMPIYEYELRYFKVKKTSNDWIRIEREKTSKIPSLHHTFTLTHLDQNSYYNITILAKNEIGLGLPKSVVIKTARMSDCYYNYCLNDGLCKLDEDGFPWCQCQSNFVGDRCQKVAGAVEVPINTILVLIVSVSLITLAIVLVSLLLLCIRLRKRSSKKR